jgi:serine acetyltransferase
VRDHVHVGADAVVGLGAVVTADVADGVTVVGNPGRDLATHKALQSRMKALLAED